jgi:hypothetical protein
VTFASGKGASPLSVWVQPRVASARDPRRSHLTLTEVEKPLMLTRKLPFGGSSRHLLDRARLNENSRNFPATPCSGVIPSGPPLSSCKHPLTCFNRTGLVPPCPSHSAQLPLDASDASQQRSDPQLEPRQQLTTSETDEVSILLGA